MWGRLLGGVRIKETCAVDRLDGVLLLGGLLDLLLKGQLWRLGLLSAVAQDKSWGPSGIACEALGKGESVSAVSAD